MGLPPLSKSPVRPIHQPKPLPPNSSAKRSLFADNEAPQTTPEPRIKASRLEESAIPAFKALLAGDFASLGEPQGEVLRLCALAAKFPNRCPENPSGKLLIPTIFRYLNTRVIHPHFLENLFFSILAGLYPDASYQELTSLSPFAIKENQTEWTHFLLNLLQLTSYQSSCSEETVSLILHHLNRENSVLLIPFCKSALAPFDQFSEELKATLIPLCRARPELFFNSLAWASEGKFGEEEHGIHRWILTIFTNSPANSLEPLVSYIFQNNLLHQEYRNLLTHFIHETQHGAPEKQGPSSLITLLLILPLAKEENVWFQRMANILPTASCHDPEFVFSRIAAAFHSYKNLTQLILELMAFIPRKGDAEHVICRLQPFIYDSNRALHRDLIDQFQRVASLDIQNGKLAAQMLAFLARKKDCEASKALADLLPEIAAKEPEWADIFAYQWLVQLEK